MANDILDFLLKANLAAGAAVLLVLLARKPLRALAGPRVAYALWLIVPLAAAGGFLPARRQIMPEVSVPFAPPAPVEQTEQVPYLAQALTAPSAPDFADPSALLIAAWVLGALVSLATVLWIQHRSVSRLGVLRTGGAEGAMIAGATGFGPAVVGAFRPRIVLPADFDDRFQPRERTMILAHEQAHLALGHARINAAVVLTQCLNWFNPLLHLAAHYLRLDQELACDAAVLARHPDGRRSYAEAMLKTQIAQAPLPLGCYWPARGAHPLKERLIMLTPRTYGRPQLMLGAGLVTALALTAGITAWAAQPAQRVAPEAPRPVQIDRAQSIPAPAPPMRKTETPRAAPATPRPAEATVATLPYPAVERPQVIDAFSGTPVRLTRQLRPGPEGRFYYSPEPVTLRFADGRTATMVITYEVDAENASEVQLYEPRIRDAFLTHGTSVTSQQLLNGRAIATLKSEVEDISRNVFTSGNIQAVLIEDIQF